MWHFENSLKWFSLIQLDFLSEAEMMKRFDHKNIVCLLGVCTRGEPAYTIMEFMLHGRDTNFPCSSDYRTSYFALPSRLLIAFYSLVDFYLPFHIMAYIKYDSCALYMNACYASENTVICQSPIATIITITPMLLLQSSTIVYFVQFLYVLLCWSSV